LGAFCLFAAQCFASGAVQNFGTVPINGAAQSLTVDYSFNGLAAAPTFALAWNRDFEAAAPACSVSTTTKCSVVVSFSPIRPGLRQDALTVKDPSGNVLATTLLRGVGESPLLAFHPGIIGTLAGNGTWGYQDSTNPANAEFRNPQGVALDIGGNELYVADSLNCVIRKFVRSSGEVSTVAGNGSDGFAGDGGPATSAKLNTPTGVAVDGAGNLYIADQGNNVIRRVDAITHIITTVVGGGTVASGTDNLGDGGPATSAILNGPQSVAVDGAGNLYIADAFSNLVRTVNAASGKITVAAGGGTAAGTDGFGDGGPAPSAQLSNPSGVALDSAGNLYIADTGDNLIRFVNLTTGVITAVAGNGKSGYTGDNGLATAATLAAPQGVAVDAANDIYIADSGNNAIRQVSGSSQNIFTVAGVGSPGYTGDAGSPTLARVNYPTTVVVDENGNLYVSDYANNVVRQILYAPSPLAFGSETVSTASAAQVVTARNIGNQALTVGNVLLSADFNRESSGSKDCEAGGTITAGSSCSAAVTFLPAQTGATMGSLTFKTNSLNQAASVQTISLSGTGLAGFQSGLHPTALSFSPQIVGTASSAQTVTLTNTGSTSLSITGIGFSGANASDFTSSSKCGSVLVVGATCSISVTFTPGAAGSRSASLVVSDKYGKVTRLPQTATLTGTGGAPTTSSATYMGADTTTLGTWTGHYGADGQLIANGLTNAPAYATVSFTGDSTYTWQQPSRDPRALQVSSGSPSRIASTYETYKSFSINMNLTDGNTHKISLYLLDWENAKRSEQITIVDTISQAVLSSESFSAFSGGIYEIWTVKGNVQIQVAFTGGNNAGVAGVFFDTPGSTFITVKNPHYGGGAAGNTKHFTNGYVSGSVASPVLNSPTANFVSQDVGKIVEIQNSCLNAGVVSTLEGTISAVTSSKRAAMTIDTSSAAHGIVCGALNSAPLLGSIIGSISSGATSAYVMLYSPTARIPATIPATPFSVVLDSGTAIRETVTVSAASQFRNVATLTFGATRYSHGVTSVLLTGTQAVEFSYGTDDTAAINAAITAAEALTKASLFFPSTTGGYTCRGARNQALPICFPLSGNGNLAFYGDGNTVIYSSGAWSVYNGAVVRNIVFGYPSTGVSINHLVMQNFSVNGMTNGNTGNTNWTPSTANGEGWDTTSKVFYLLDSTANDIEVSNVNWQHFKGELFYLGGSSSSYANISVTDSYFADSNGDGFSPSASTINIAGNAMYNFANACIEEGTTDGYLNYVVQNNICSDSLRSGFVFVGAINSGVTNTGQHTIENNRIFFTGLMPGSFTVLAAIGVVLQVSSTTPLSHFKITNNTITDCVYGFDVEAINDAVISGNTYLVDATPNTYYPKGVVLYGNQNTGDSVSNLSVRGNIFRRSALAVTNGTQLTPIAETSGSELTFYKYTNVVIADNLFDVTQPVVYNGINSPVTIWAALTQSNSAPAFANNSFPTPTYADSNFWTSQVPANTVYPICDFVQIEPGSSGLQFTFPNGGAQDGAIVNVYLNNANAGYWNTDANLRTPGVINHTIQQSVTFRYSADAGKWIYLSGGTVTN
jgi:sugar lactone lactonase YvrE